MLDWLQSRVYSIVHANGRLHPRIIPQGPED
jgi:hypothetical protein